MKYLLSPSGQKHLEKMWERTAHGRILLAFDYDGTLAPIVENLLQAQLPDSTRELLSQLAHVATIALISGRSISDLKSKCKFKPSPHFLIGNHGMQGIPKLERHADRFRQICSSWKITLADVVRTLGPGVILEDKKYSLSLHYRQSPNKAIVRRRLLTAIEKLKPKPRVIGGKLLLNLVPEGAPNKGVALQNLMRQYRFHGALYVGDDETDEDVFKIDEPSLVTIRIGHKKSSASQFYLRRQNEIDRLLRILLQNLHFRS